MEIVTIRAYESDLKEWKRKANLRGFNLSEWIRRVCNAAPIGPLAEYTDFRGTESLRRGTGSVFPSPESEKGNGSTDDQNVRRVEAGSVPRRRSSVSRHPPTRSSKSSRSKTVESIPRMGAAPTVLSTESIVVTRDNFAEVLATIPKDEIDRWARSLPPDVLPKHAGSANRLTDLCASCLEYRRVQGIPYGGAPKAPSIVEQMKTWTRCADATT